MSWLDAIDAPSDTELRAIELEGDVLAAELRLVDAEVSFAATPSRATAASFLQALLDVVDLHDFTDDGEDQAVRQVPLADSLCWEVAV